MNKVFISDEDMHVELDDFLDETKQMNEKVRVWWILSMINENLFNTYIKDYIEYALAYKFYRDLLTNISRSKNVRL